MFYAPLSLHHSVLFFFVPFLTSPVVVDSIGGSLRTSPQPPFPAPIPPRPRLATCPPRAESPPHPGTRHDRSPPGRPRAVIARHSGPRQARSRLACCEK